MKTIKGLNTKPVSVDEEVEMEEASTFKRYMKDQVALHIPKGGQNSIELYQVGLKLKQTEDEIAFEDAEFNLLKSTINQNPAGQRNHIHAQICMLLNEAEKNGTK